MKIIIDAPLSPHLALWIVQNLNIESVSVKYLGLRDAEDFEIFSAAREMNAIVMTKDEDFIRLHFQLGSPPKIIWITCGNTSNKRMKEILQQKLPETLLVLGEFDLVAISD